MRKWYLAAVLVAVLVIGAFGGVFLLGLVPNTDRHTLRLGKHLAADLLIDPSSAQYRRTEISEGIDPKHPDPPVICGEINGKNRNGAYVGFTKFMAQPSTGAVTLRPQTRWTKEDADRQLRRCKSAAKGPFYFEEQRDLARMECQQGSDMAKELSNVAQFDLIWTITCGSSKD